MNIDHLHYMPCLPWKVAEYQALFLLPEKTKDKIPQLLITLKYDGREPVIHSLKRVSKPGQRRYVKSGEIGKVLNGFGISVLSTPRGIMTNWEALRDKVGGEVICEVY